MSALSVPDGDKNPNEKLLLNVEMFETAWEELKKKQLNTDVTMLGSYLQCFCDMALWTHGYLTVWVAFTWKYKQVTSSQCITTAHIKKVL